MMLFACLSMRCHVRDCLLAFIYFYPCFNAKRPFPSNSNWHLAFHLSELSSVAAPTLSWLEMYRQQTFTFSTSNIIWDLNPQHWRCTEIDI